MNLQIINDCAGTDPELPTAGTDPGQRCMEGHFASQLKYHGLQSCFPHAVIDMTKMLLYTYLYNKRLIFLYQSFILRKKYDFLIVILYIKTLFSYISFSCKKSENPIFSHKENTFITKIILFLIKINLFSYNHIFIYNFVLNKNSDFSYRIFS